MTKCPRDGTALDEKVIKGQTVFDCATCHGLWLPKSVILTAIKELPDLSDQPNASRLCPMDYTDLVAVRHQGVEVDVCRNCGGVWLDPGELAQILGKNKAKGSKSNSALDVAGGIVDVAGMGVDVVAHGGEVASDALSAVLEVIGGIFSGL